MQNKNRETITFIGGLLGILVAILTIGEKTPVIVKLIPVHNSTAYTEILNILILIFFYFSLKPRTLTLEDNTEIVELARRLGVEDHNYQQLKFNNDRVNKLIAQICTTLTWFISTLLVFYAINLLKDVDGETFNKWNSPFPYMDVLETMANGVSGAFIYLSFVILYNTTLDEKNKSSTFYKGTVFFLILFFGTYIFLLNTNLDRTTVSNVFKLLCGIYNGLAMVLLFGRIASMEFYFKNLNDSNRQSYKNVYVFGATFLLPLYVLAQPMYGILEFPELESSAHLFKAVVFLICFIGKGFFLLFMTNRINNKWLHAYLHLALANSKRSESVFDTISGNHKPSTDNGSPISSFLIDVQGEYEYKCIQRNKEHSHGGTCTIEQVTNHEDAVEWKLVGARKWTKDGNSDKIIFELPYQWETKKGVIFRDKSYMYTYHIDVELESISGISRGNITFSDGNKEILEFEGIYYQQSGNEIVWGSEHFKKTR